METIITRDIQKCADAIKAGKIVAFGTDTVYGVGADCFNEDAVKSIFALKGRPMDRPVNVLVASVSQARGVAGEWTDEAELLAKAFWPGAITLVLPKSSAVPSLVTAGGETVGVRMPAQDVALEFIRACGVPLATPSANPTGKISATKAEHVKKYFNGSLPYVLDTGKCSGGIESTVYDVEKRLVLRVGSVNAENIESVIGKPVSVAETGSGQTPHYKPSYRLILVIGEDADKKLEELRNSAGKDGLKCVILDIHGKTKSKDETAVGFNGDIKRLETSLYDTLLSFEGKTDLMIVKAGKEGKAETAVLHRLKNAADKIIYC